MSRQMLPVFWPPGREYNARCGEGSGPFCSWFLVPPFRPTFAGPVLRGAQQPHGNVSVTPCTVCTGMRPGVPVDGYAQLCTSGVVANGSCR
jgi:hypothetical protein